MRLTDLEKGVLWSAFLHARKDAAQIALETGYRATSVRRCLSRLEDRELIRKYTFLNIHALGLAHYGVFFSVSAQRSGVYQEVLDHLIRSPRVSLVMELGGEFQFGISIVGASPQEAFGYFEEFTDSFGGNFPSRALSIRTRLIHFSAKYLISDQRPSGSLQWGGSPPRANVDQTDLKILAAISQQYFESRSMLARHLGLPLSSLKYRIQKLERSGVIVGDVMILNTQRVGIASYYFLVYCRGSSPKFRERFIAFCRQHPNIMYAVECFGTWDFELGGHFEEQRQAVSLVESLHTLFPDFITRVSVLPVFSKPKVSNFPLSEQQITTSATPNYAHSEPKELRLLAGNE